jgi:calcium/calmodulin-dependent protein kinase I
MLEGLETRFDIEKFIATSGLNLPFGKETLASSLIGTGQFSIVFKGQSRAYQWSQPDERGSGRGIRTSVSSTSFGGGGLSSSRSNPSLWERFNTPPPHSNSPPLGGLSQSYGRSYSGSSVADDDELVEDCAFKVIDKSIFRQLVNKNCERPDTLLRELATQATLSGPCMCSKCYAQGNQFGEGVRPSKENDTSSANSSARSTSSSAKLSQGCGGSCKIVQLQGTFETPDYLILQLELMEGDDLFQFVSSHGSVPEKDVSHVVHDILESLVACKAHGLVHRDVKLANLMFASSKGNDEGSDGDNWIQSGLFKKNTNGMLDTVKLLDFGMATFVSQGNYASGRCGTPGFVAPEILKAQGDELYGTNVDIFSVGVVAFTLLCGYEPFNGNSLEELLDANSKGMFEFDHAYWSDVSTLAKDFILRVMDPNPHTRITPEEAMHHAWLRSFNT